MNARLPIWRLETEGDRYLSLIPHDLNYFHDHFTGRTMTDWQAPPITINGKTKRLPDFVLWMIGAPIVSERAWSALESLLGAHVQLLPFHHLKEKRYFALNVLEVLHDVLDLKASDVTYSKGDPPIALHLGRTMFSGIDGLELPPMFKISAGKEQKPFGEIFVTRPFVDIALAQGFKGLALADPSRDSFRDVLDRRARNAVPGLPT